MRASPNHHLPDRLRRPRFVFQRDLGFRLLAWYTIFVLPLVGMVLYFNHLAVQRLRESVTNSSLSLAEAVAQETNLSLGSFLGTAKRLGENPAVLAADPDGMEVLFAALAHNRPEVSLVYRLNYQGIMLYHYPKAGEVSMPTIGFDFSFRRYFQTAKYHDPAHLPFFSRGRISPTTGDAVVTAVMPLWQNHQFSGIVGINIRLSTLSLALQHIASTHQTSENFTLFIVDKEGDIVASSASQQNGHSQGLLDNIKAIAPALDDLRQQQQTQTAIVTVNKQEMLYAYAPISSMQWGVLVGRSTASAFTTANAINHATHLALLVVISAGVLFWMALSFQVLQPLENMAAYSRSIGQEGPHPREENVSLAKLAHRRDQVGHLARTLMRMESDIAARMQELHTLLETSAAVASTLDSHSVLERILAQVERLLDVHKCAIIAWDEQRGAFVAKASRGLSPQYASRLVIERDAFNSLTLRALQVKQPMQISDTETDPSATAIRPRARAEGYRAVLAVPLPTQHTPPAALVVYTPAPHTFSQREIDLLTSFANHAAMAIENAALFARSDARLQEQTRRLEALIQSMNDAILLEDHHGKVLYANRRMALLANLTPEEMSGIEASRIVQRILGQAAIPAAAQAAFTRAAEEGGAEIHLRLHGKMTTWQVHTFSVTDSQGISIGRGQIWKDRTADREIDRMKASLMSTVSHELRTPLASIKGWVSTLLADDVAWDAQSQREFLRTISDETDRLSALVNDLLDLSRIEGGNIQVRRAPIDNLEEIIARAAKNAHPSPAERLQVHLPENMPTLLADQRHLEVVLRNLIENAAKYGNKATPVVVSAAVEPEQIVIRVEDEGPGIPAEHVPHIFESFYRVESGLTRQASGAGLGLAICRGFVEAHGGKIWVEPRAHGTCIAFSLPLTPQEPLTDSPLSS